MNFQPDGGPLDKSQAVPLYHQLRVILEQRIQQGHWKPNDRLPTEDEICEQFKVSKATVRQALQELASAGFVRREQGRGTFVADNKIQFGPKILSSFTDEMRDTGMKAGSRVLEKALIPASIEVAAKLDVPVGSLLFMLTRLRLAADEPMGIQTAYVPNELAPGLSDIDFTTASLYETLQQKYGLMADHATQLHFATIADAGQAQLLGIAPGAPLVGGERLTYLRGGRPLELTHSAMRGDRYQIQLKLVRPR
jgi:GntR family transcriptional regulator